MCYENPKNKITAVPANEEEIWGATFKVTKWNQYIYINTIAAGTALLSRRRYKSCLGSEAQLLALGHLWSFDGTVYNLELKWK